MPVFHAKARTLESYLAGIGASTALLAGALVLFVVLVGAAIFDSWPRPADVFSEGGDDNVTLDTSAAAAQSAAQSSTPNLIGLLGGPGPTARAGAAPSGTGNPVRGGGVDHDLGGPGGTPQPGGGTEEPPSHGAQPPSQNPPAPSPTGSRNVVQQTVSNVGNAVESDTTALSNDLGGSDSLVGGLVGGVGNTLNNTLQSLAGNR